MRVIASVQLRVDRARQGRLELARGLINALNQALSTIHDLGGWLIGIDSRALNLLVEEKVFEAARLLPLVNISKIFLQYRLHRFALCLLTNF